MCVCVKALQIRLLVHTHHRKVQQQALSCGVRSHKCFVTLKDNKQASHKLLLLLWGLMFAGAAQAMVTYMQEGVQTCVSKVLPAVDH